MGISLSSVHIYGNNTPVCYSHLFRSFSPNWATCIENFDKKSPDYSYQFAKNISRQIDTPVLHFGVFDSEIIWFDFFLGGKIISRYSDDEFVSNKKLYDIPTLIGYSDGHKKRLSTILSCADIDTKISMLEEYFGVCLLFHPEFMDEPDTLLRGRSDNIYRQYIIEEKALTGKTAPLALELIAEYPGKLFCDVFGSHETMKPHFFLHGYSSDSLLTGHSDLTPVRFTGPRLEKSSLDIFKRDRIPRRYEDPRFQMHYGTPCKVTFAENCPPDYLGQTMTLPSGFYPQEFLPSGELLLYGSHRIFVVDQTLKVIAKLSIKGEVADVLGNYILTTTGDSFCGYCYEPKAKIYIYEIVKKQLS